MRTGEVVKVSGPLVVAKNMQDAKIYDVVSVSEENLIGEIIEMRGDMASIQVYEETSMLGPGEVVVTRNEPLSVELGPGLIENMFDGIQRPLQKIMDVAGDFITRGVSVPSLDRDRVWSFEPRVERGAKVTGGDIIGVVQENIIIEHRIMVPPGLSGTIVSVERGDFKVTDVVAVLKTDSGETHELTMMQKWPVRISRPTKTKLNPTTPMITGQRVVDTFFPVAKGGTACVPGPFGSGKTVIQHQLAKWSDVEVVVYVGCGERGNEMTDVLNEFPELVDPRTGESLMKRVVLIANTSNMPVAAREASIYTGITIAEYFRDMGYSVALMADSSSRWAEALREMSGRLEEMPGEEGYPAYLSSRLAEFYERAGYVQCLGSDERYGTLTAIGAVSPPGGDISEPVSQATLRIVKVFWGLDSNLAYQRHFPAINWLTSYSQYLDNVSGWINENIAADFSALRVEAMIMLQDESQLNEIVRLVGYDSLSESDQMKLEIAKSIREDYLQQNSFHELDSYASFDKQARLLRLVLHFGKKASEALAAGVAIKPILALEVREKIARAKYTPEDDLGAIDAIGDEVTSSIDELMRKELSVDA